MIFKNSRPYLYLLNAIKWQLFVVLIVVTITAILGEYLDAHTDIEHPIGVPAFFGTAIVFILAFRTNQAYDRWWEARKIWGAIVNSSRTWTRMVLTIIEFTPDTEHIRTRLIKRQAAWCYLLTFRLRDKYDYESIKPYLSDEEFERLQTGVNGNQLISLWQSEDLRDLNKMKQIEDWHHIEFEECLKDFEASMGKAERIKNTHFPVLYDHLVHLSIFMFASLMAFAIVDSAHLFEISFSTLIAALFLAMEQIAREMQDPFDDQPSDTPISSISHSIERGMMQMLGEEILSAPPVQGKFYSK